MFSLTMLGSGYAGAAVVGDACILFHRQGDQAIAERLDAATGNPRWKKSFATHYASAIAPDNGPRCTALVHKDRVYLFGADGDLHAVSLADGDVLWTRDLYRECEAPTGYFGAGSSPIVEGDSLLVNVGGKHTLFNALVAMELPGPGSVFLHQEWDYPAAVHIGDTVTAEAEVLEARAVFE
jgi:outer membrane protein assembly factor BamB